MGSRWHNSTLTERFWEKVVKTDGCWLWSGALNEKGYGAINVSGGKMAAHRLAWKLEHGAAPTGSVLHSCDVRNCVNPAHLSVGTQADNMRQAKERGRLGRAGRGLGSIGAVAPWRTEESRFWSKVRKSDDCWIWVGATADRKYGVFAVRSGQRILAHRWSYERVNGPVSAAAFVMHICDNPSCVRPDHLKERTRQENIADMVSKGRARNKHTAHRAK